MSASVHVVPKKANLVLVATLCLASLAGCIGSSDVDGVGPGAALAESLDITVRVADNDPLAFVKAAVADADSVLALGSTNESGLVTLVAPAGADRIHVVWPDGALATYGMPDNGILDVSWNDASMLDAMDGDVGLGPGSALGLVVERIHDFGSRTYPVAVGTSCLNVLSGDTEMDCGLSEPTIEVAGDGSIYYSAVCCIGGAPPVWVSRDDGASWSELETTLGQREAFGIEGDFAIDDVGNVYFFDIELGNIQLTAWDKDGVHLHTVHWPSPPLVDRPWVRAEGDGIVYIVYNQGVGQSTFMRSTDHGLTFPATTWQTLPFNFANLARGTEDGELWATGGRGATIPAWHSLDGGRTWMAEEAGRTPDGPSFGNRVPVVDTLGTPYIFFDSRAADGTMGDEKDDVAGGYHIYYVWRDAEGTWSDPIQVGPTMGSHYFPWPAAAGPGRVAVAWYGTLEDDAGPNDVADGTAWHLYMATSLDAASERPGWQTIIADPEPLLTGPVDRRLLDFVQADIGPDGAIHVGYAHDVDDDGKETALYLKTYANLPLVDPLAGILNGPHAPRTTDG